MGDPGAQDEVTEREAEADRAASCGDAAGARRILEDITAATPARVEPWLKLAAMCRAEGDLEAALAAVTAALRIDPLGFLPLLLKASLLEASGRANEAGETYGHALAQRPEAIPPGLAGAVANAERSHAAHVAATGKRLAAAIAPLEKSLAAKEQRRLRRFHSNIVRTTRPYHSEPSHFHYPGLTERGWYLLTRNWIGYFLVMAVLNEAVWRLTSTDTWVAFKLWVFIPATFLFAAANVPMLLRHGLGDEKPETPDLPPE